MIIPPCEIRQIIEKTSQFVRKNGRNFEEKLKEKEKGNPKFSFLNPIDPYHSFYTLLLEDPSFITKIEALQEVKNDDHQIGPDYKKFHEHSFFISELPLVSLFDWLVLESVAKFKALNPVDFFEALNYQEHGNSLFSFIKGSNPNHVYLLKLIDQYSSMQEFDKIFTKNVSEYDLIRESFELADQKRLRESLLFFQSDKANDLEELFIWDIFEIIDAYDFFQESKQTPFLRQSDFLRLSISQRANFWLQSPTLSNLKSMSLLLCSFCNRIFSSSEYDAHIRKELLDPRWHNQKINFK